MPHFIGCRALAACCVMAMLVALTGCNADAPIDGSGLDDAAATVDIALGADGTCPSQCDDGNPCTQDGCDAAGLTCTHDAVPGCGVSAPCTSASDCPGGICNPATRICVGCLGDSACAAGSLCRKLVCQPATPCKSDAACKSAKQVCNNALGVCVDCVLVSDCAVGLVCAEHKCAPAPVTCSSSNDCPMVCNKLQGVCAECAVSADCAPGHFCAADGTCALGVCSGSVCANGLAYACASDGSTFLQGVPCDDAEACTTDSCVPGAGCRHVAATVACSDGDACTTNDACAKGTCTGGAPLDCNDLNACTLDKCLPAVGCVHTPSLAACDDGISCTMDACADASCSHVANDAMCEDGNACTTNACEASGCQHVQLAGSPCDDGDPCTVLGTCNGGFCVSTPNLCDDGNLCTQDFCDGSGGCAHVNAPGACNDGDPCTNSEICSGGVCSAPLSGGMVSTAAGGYAVGDVDASDALAAKLNGPHGLARLPDGSFLISEPIAHRIRRYSVADGVSTWAGSSISGSADGAIANATFVTPEGIAVDASGVVYVADSGSHRIRRIVSGVVDTFAGKIAGFADGAGTLALFNAPRGLATDASGALWVADRLNHRIRRITPNGVVSSIAGSGVSGFKDGPSLLAQFNQPCAVLPTSAGGAVVGDCGNYRLRLIAADGSVTTLAGSGYGSNDGSAAVAKMGTIGGLAKRGDLWLFSDVEAQHIRSVTASGTVTTIAGGYAWGSFTDGPALSASFSAPASVALDTNGALFIADKGNNRLRKLTFPSQLCDDGKACTVDACATGGCTFTPVPTGSACDDGSACTSGETCNGAGQCQGTAKACDDGVPCTADACIPVSGACVHVPLSSACDDGDACTLADSCASGTCGSASTVVSTPAGGVFGGWMDGSGPAALFQGVSGITRDAKGGLWVADTNNHLIRQITAAGVVTTIGGKPYSGFADGPAGSAVFSGPTHVLFDPSDGGLLIADTGNNRVRKYVAGQVSTLAGNGKSGYVDGPAATAEFNGILAMAWHPSGDLYLADHLNRRIRSIASDGTVATVAGSAYTTSADGPIATASFADPVGVCIAKSGVVYVVDAGKHAIRRIQNGIVDTVAGSKQGFADGTGANALFNTPASCAVDDAGRVYVVDRGNYRLRRIDASGSVTTLAGMGASWLGSYPKYLPPVDGPVASAVFAWPSDAVLGPFGQVWLADGNAIRAFSPAAVDCDDGSPCTADVCDAKTAACSHNLVPNGGPCASGKFCVIGETCSSGVCGGGASDLCDDKNACTNDSCDAQTGCKHAFLGGPGCCEPTEFSNDFESADAKGISFVNSAGVQKGWQVWLGSPITSLSTPASKGILYYGDPKIGNYDLGGVNNGTATLPPIALNLGLASTLNFDLYMDVENGLAYDTLTATVTNAAGVSALVWDKSTDTPFAVQVWSTVTVDLSGYKGQIVTIAFHFNTVDGVSNTGWGVAIDNLAVLTTCQ
jgi:sugar lactone lactonase YvrE